MYCKMMKSLNMCHKKAGNLRGTEAKLAALQDEEGRRQANEECLTSKLMEYQKEAGQARCVESTATALFGLGTDLQNPEERALLAEKVASALRPARHESDGPSLADRVGVLMQRNLKLQRQMASLLEQNLAVGTQPDEPQARHVRSASEQVGPPQMQEESPVKGRSRSRQSVRVFGQKVLLERQQRRAGSEESGSTRPTQDEVDTQAGFVP
eukprot:g21165.t1